MGKFIGTYHRSLDEKGRFQLPPKLLGEVEPLYYLMPGFEGCLSLYPSSSFDNLLERLENMDYFKSKARRLLRLNLSKAEALSLDAHGRISLRKELVDEKGLKGEVTLIGALDHIEIWDEEAFKKYLEEGESLEELSEHYDDYSSYDL